MLALMLSGVVGLASLVFFLSAFFAPKLHRKDDFLWSGFGFFYALVLWICAQRFTGAILLGQLAGISVILAFAWQTLRLRAAIANQAIAEIPSFSLLDWVGGGVKRKPKAPKVQPKQEPEAVPSTPEVPASAKEATVTEQAIEQVDQVLETIEAPAPVVEAVEEIVQSAIAATVAKTETTAPDNSEPESPPPAVIADPPKTPPAPPSNGSSGAPRRESLQDRPQPKSKLFQWLFGGKKQDPAPSNIAAVIESTDAEEDDWGEGETVAEMITTVEEALEDLEEEVAEHQAESEIESETPESPPVPAEIEEVVAVVEEALEEIINPEEVGESEPEPEPSNDKEPEPSVVAEVANITEIETSEPEMAESEAEPESAPEAVTETTVETVTTEESNWDDFDQEFEPQVDDVNTVLENPDDPNGPDSPEKSN